MRRIEFNDKEIAKYTPHTSRELSNGGKFKLELQFTAVARKTVGAINKGN